MRTRRRIGKLHIGRVRNFIIGDSVKDDETALTRGMNIMDKKRVNIFNPKSYGKRQFRSARPSCDDNIKIKYVKEFNWSHLKQDVLQEVCSI